VKDSPMAQLENIGDGFFCDVLPEMLIFSICTPLHHFNR
jgi:hypothetical protein